MLILFDLGGAHAGILITLAIAVFISNSVQYPIRKVLVQEQLLDLVSRLSMRRTMASRTNATTVLAWRSDSRISRRLRLIQANVRSTIQRYGSTTQRCASERFTISIFQQEYPPSAYMRSINGKRERACFKRSIAACLS